MSAARFLVAGRVQGVCFRAWTRERALALGLAGRAVNLEDGRVEVLARGTGQALDALERDLWRGPPQARVDSVRREACDPGAAPAGATGFTTG